ncbi:MAG TPA: hypothetical protein VN694_03195 [Caulobacteraceae bacterium]|nr:hypothetical protein [Caulobacteraceae bacterium]
MRTPRILAVAGLAIVAARGGPVHAAGGGSYTTYYFSGTVPRVQPHVPAPPRAEDLADLKLKPLVASGDPPSARPGLFAKGDAFFTVGVRHAVTGVLTSEVRAHVWFFADKPLPAGQPVYGIPMSGSNGAGMVWCAPVREARQGVPHWRAICLPKNDDRFAWIEAKPAMMTLNLSWIGGLEHVAGAPAVERRPVDFPPMTLSYAFGGWNRDGWLILDVRLDWGEGPQALHAILVPPGPNGGVDLHLMQGELSVRPSGASGDAAAVEVLSAPRPDAPIAY